jgi:general stress protein 26
MTTEPETKLHDLLADFGVAMLTTHSEDGEIRARPMAMAEVEPDGTLWFLTDRHSPKIAEIAKDSRVVVTMQSSLKYVSFSGIASAVEDRERVARLWKLEWKVWFPGGKDDPNLTLVRIDGHAGEYWDNSGMNGVKYLFQAGKALLTGSRPAIDYDPQIHGKVGM